MPKFKQCTFWDIGVMTEMFRLELLTLMVKQKVLAAEVADNLMRWQNSGFHVYATEPFEPADKQTLINRLAYAYRLPAPLNRLSFNDWQVTVEAREQALTLTPVDFIAKLTLHTRVFGEIPIACPRCGMAMDLKEFIFDVRWICSIPIQKGVRP